MTNETLEQLAARLEADERDTARVGQAIEKLTDRIGVWVRWLVGTMVVAGLGTGGVIIAHLMDGHPGRVLREVELLRDDQEELEEAVRSANRSAQEANRLLLELVRELARDRAEEGGE